LRDEKKRDDVLAFILSSRFENIVTCLDVDVHYARQSFYDALTELAELDKNKKSATLRLADEKKESARG